MLVLTWVVLCLHVVRSEPQYADDPNFPDDPNDPTSPPYSPKPGYLPKSVDQQLPDDPYYYDLNTQRIAPYPPKSRSSYANEYDLNDSFEPDRTDALDLNEDDSSEENAQSRRFLPNNKNYRVVVKQKLRIRKPKKFNRIVRTKIRRTRPLVHKLIRHYKSLRTPEVSKVYKIYRGGKKGTRFINLTLKDTDSNSDSASGEETVKTIKTKGYSGSDETEQTDESLEKVYKNAYTQKSKMKNSQSYNKQELWKKGNKVNLNKNLDVATVYKDVLNYDEGDARYHSKYKANYNEDNGGYMINKKIKNIPVVFPNQLSSSEEESDYYTEHSSSLQNHDDKKVNVSKTYEIETKVTYPKYDSPRLLYFPKEESYKETVRENRRPNYVITQLLNRVSPKLNTYKEETVNLAPYRDSLIVDEEVKKVVPEYDVTQYEHDVIKSKGFDEESSASKEQESAEIQHVWELNSTVHDHAPEFTEFSKRLQQVQHFLTQYTNKGQDDVSLTENKKPYISSYYDKDNSNIVLSDQSSPVDKKKNSKIPLINTLKQNDYNYTTNLDSLGESHSKVKFGSGDKDDVFYIGNTKSTPINEGNSSIILLNGNISQNDSKYTTNLDSLRYLLLNDKDDHTPTPTDEDLSVIPLGTHSEQENLKTIDSYSNNEETNYRQHKTKLDSEELMPDLTEQLPTLGPTNVAENYREVFEDIAYPEEQDYATEQPVPDSYVIPEIFPKKTDVIHNYRLQQEYTAKRPVLVPYSFEQDYTTEQTVPDLYLIPEKTDVRPIYRQEQEYTTKGPVPVPYSLEQDYTTEQPIPDLYKSVIHPDKTDVIQNYRQKQEYTTKGPVPYSLEKDYTTEPVSDLYEPELYPEKAVIQNYRQEQDYTTKGPVPVLYSSEQDYATEQPIPDLYLLPEKADVRQNYHQEQYYTTKGPVPVLYSSEQDYTTEKSVLFSSINQVFPKEMGVRQKLLSDKYDSYEMSGAKVVPATVVDQSKYIPDYLSEEGNVGSEVSTEKDTNLSLSVATTPDSLTLSGTNERTGILEKIRSKTLPHWLHSEFNYLRTEKSTVKPQHVSSDSKVPLTWEYDGEFDETMGFKGKSFYLPKTPTHNFASVENSHKLLYIEGRGTAQVRLCKLAKRNLKQLRLLVATNYGLNSDTADENNLITIIYILGKLNEAKATKRPVENLVDDFFVSLHRLAVLRKLLCKDVDNVHVYNDVTNKDATDENVTDEVTNKHKEIDILSLLKGYFDKTRQNLVNYYEKYHPNNGNVANDHHTEWWDQRKPIRYPHLSPGRLGREHWIIHPEDKEVRINKWDPRYPIKPPKDIGSEDILSKLLEMFNKDQTTLAPPTVGPSYLETTVSPHIKDAIDELQEVPKATPYPDTNTNTDYENGYSSTAPQNNNFLNNLQTHTQNNNFEANGKTNVFDNTNVLTESSFGEYTMPVAFEDWAPTAATYVDWATPPNSHVDLDYNVDPNHPVYLNQNGDLNPHLFFNQNGPFDNNGDLNQNLDLNQNVDFNHPVYGDQNGDLNSHLDFNQNRPFDNNVDLNQHFDFNQNVDLNHPVYVDQNGDINPNLDFNQIRPLNHNGDLNHHADFNQNGHLNYHLVLNQNGPFNNNEDLNPHLDFNPNKPLNNNGDLNNHLDFNQNGPLNHHGDINQNLDLNQNVDLNHPVYGDQNGDFNSHLYFNQNGPFDNNVDLNQHLDFNQNVDLNHPVYVDQNGDLNPNLEFNQNGHLNHNGDLNHHADFNQNGHLNYHLDLNQNGPFNNNKDLNQHLDFNQNGPLNNNVNLNPHLDFNPNKPLNNNGYLNHHLDFNQNRPLNHDGDLNHHLDFNHIGPPNQNGDLSHHYNIPEVETSAEYEESEENLNQLPETHHGLNYGTKRPPGNAELELNARHFNLMLDGRKLQFKLGGKDNDHHKIKIEGVLHKVDLEHIVNVAHFDAINHTPVDEGVRTLIELRDRVNEAIFTEYIWGQIQKLRNSHVAEHRINKYVTVMATKVLPGLFKALKSCQDVKLGMAKKQFNKTP